MASRAPGWSKLVKGSFVKGVSMAWASFAVCRLLGGAIGPPFVSSFIAPRYGEILHPLAPTGDGGRLVLGWGRASHRRLWSLSVKRGGGSAAGRADPCGR